MLQVAQLAIGGFGTESRFWDASRQVLGMETVGQYNAYVNALLGCSTNNLDFEITLILHRQFNTLRERASVKQRTVKPLKLGEDHSQGLLSLNKSRVTSTYLMRKLRE